MEAYFAISRKGLVFTTMQNSIRRALDAYATILTLVWYLSHLRIFLKTAKVQELS